MWPVLISALAISYQVKWGGDPCGGTTASFDFAPGRLSAVGGAQLRRVSCRLSLFPASLRKSARSYAREALAALVPRVTRKGTYVFGPESSLLQFFTTAVARRPYSNCIGEA